LKALLRMTFFFTPITGLPHPDEEARDRRLA
jgi:hypothetical protein